MWLDKIEKITKLSGYAIARHLGIRDKDYYRWRSNNAWPTRKYICGLAHLPNMNWKKLGRLIEMDLEENGEWYYKKRHRRTKN